MKLYAPNYYGRFQCIADRCRHTCCVGWEIDVDEESLARFSADPGISRHIEAGEPAHIRLLPGDRCPFLTEKGLCAMILDHGPDVLCQICRDHPRFRNFWTDRTEVGLGLVCEEAARLILFSPEPMRLVLVGDDGASDPMPPEEQRLLALRNELLQQITEAGPGARLREYLIYRHLPDALYDGLTEARLRFIRDAYEEITEAWGKTDGSPEALTECARIWSYDVEYDDEVINHRLVAYAVP